MCCETICTDLFLLCADIFYVQGDPFFHTISRKVQFRTVAPLLNRNKATLLREIKPVLAMYKPRGFNISDLHADMEFECIRNDVLPSRLNVTAADNHVGKVKQSIWTMKERARTTIHGLLFKRLPKLTGRANRDYNDLKLEFGSYVQVFEDNTPSSTTTSRSTGAIILDPTDTPKATIFLCHSSSENACPGINGPKFP